ncbi:MAG: ABC transporter ATP-binding protein, partial [Ignavibacteriales bacterium]|nr:ABC transporter ATP-binding protein [Ignavibacteriales bacterium]
MKTPILQSTNVQKIFTNDKKESSRLHVLKGIDFIVEESEIVSIVGVSGSGKSTLLHILGGLDRPNDGKVLWSDIDIFSLNEEALAKIRGEYVGFVFQFHHLLSEFTALENVMIPLMIQSKSKSFAEADAQKLLEDVGLANRIDHKPNERSGGEQQRVAVARALANKPKIVFADEPTGNLDSINSQQIHELLIELNKQQKQTFVIVTHNEKFAEQSNRVFRMV